MFGGCGWCCGTLPPRGAVGLQSPIYRTRGNPLPGWGGLGGTQTSCPHRARPRGAPPPPSPCPCPRRFGRRPVLLVCIVSILIFGLAVALSVNVTMFSTLRFFEGFCLAGVILTLYALRK